jgi:hypothetical protein
MDKNIKETMLSLEGAVLQSAREKYFDYVADAWLDRSEPIESDEQAQAEIAPRRWHRFNNQRSLDHRVSPSYFRLVCKGIRAGGR